MEKLMNYLVGQVIKTLKADPKNRNRFADPVLIRSILEELLEEEAKKQNQNKPVESRPSAQV